MNGTHVPVLASEVIEALGVAPGKRYIDATLGAGGHTGEMVKRGATVLGIDQDQDALTLATQNLRDRVPEAFEEGRVIIRHGNFSDIGEIAKEEGFGQVDGILFDLGISSMQLDNPERGISYRFTDAPLDMRMDTSGGDTAAQLVNQAGRDELYDIIGEYGEEELAGKLADAIVRARSVSAIETVGDLVKVIAEVVPNENGRDRVSARVFQALRIAVNDELGVLKRGLESAFMVLKPEGKLAVISFHSLEDRIVKLFMRRRGFTMLKKHIVTPGSEELAQNKRSRSAKLRVARKTNI